MGRFNKDTPTAFQNLSKEQLEAVRAKGREKKKQAIKRKKAMKDLMILLLSQKATVKEIEAVKEVLPPEYAEEIDKQTVMLVRQLQKAISKGDTKAAEFCQSTAGEKPTDVVEVNGSNGIVYITPEMQESVDKHIKDMIE